MTVHPTDFSFRTRAPAADRRLFLVFESSRCPGWSPSSAGPPMNDRGPSKRSLPARFRQTRRADMPRTVFLGLVLAWGGALVGLFAVALAIRWLG